MKRKLEDIEKPILDHFSNKETTCPVCNQSFVDTELQIHVNACLDQESPSQDKVTPWLQLFSRKKQTIQGLWSSEEDKAPGLDVDESTWFGSRQQLPYFKWLAGTNWVVDAFSYGKISGCEGYLLSHFHSDHYMGLNKYWKGPIYCSEITARLVEQKLRVSKNWIHPLPMDVPCKLPGGLTVTLIDANHCPGAVVFLVEFGPFRYLHTGDFRACPKLCIPLKGKPVDILYLDTTYLDHKYTFPAQVSCIKAACDVVKRHLDGVPEKKIEKCLIEDKEQEDTTKERLLVVVGAYTLGKERIFVDIAKSMNSKIFVTEEKWNILSTFHDKELDAMLTNDTKEAQVHVIPLGHIDPKKLGAYFNSLKPTFSQMIAFRPTGWTFQASANHQQQHQCSSLSSIIKARTPDLDISTLKPSYDTPQLKIFGIPYSEHSSFRELALFIASLDIRRIVPTVNVHCPKSREKMSLLFEKWAKEKKKLHEVVIDSPSLDYW